MMSAIKITGLEKSYGQLRAVDGLDLEIREKEVFGILGPNGAGKTTTMEMVETLRQPDAGEILVLGHNTRDEPRRIKELLGVQLQTTVFFDNLSVAETIDLFSSFYSNALPRADLLAMVGLEDKAHARVDGLSGGQHKRLSIALALVNDPSIVFLDEPTTGLDPQARRRIWDIVDSLREQEKTVVITTHYIEEAEQLCDRVAIMDRGSVIALGSPQELISNHTTESTITFLLDPPLEESLVASIEGVTTTLRKNGEYTVTTASPQSTLLGIFTTAYNNHSTADEITMRRATLEDVFLKITGRRIRE